MSESSTPAHLYFRPPTGGFWRWAERGRALTWNDGTTIAFREEIATVLERLAPLGLPPFGAVALLLAACSETFQPLKLRDERFGKLADELAPFESRTIGTLGRVVFTGLDQIRALPKPQRSPLSAKTLIAEVVCERSPRRRSIEHSKLIASCFRRGLGPETLGRDDGDEWTLQGLLDDLNSLKPGLVEFSPDALSLRAQTGLDATVEAAELEAVPFADRLRTLVRELLKDDEHAGLARAVQRLAAAASLPRPLSSPDDLSLGGISDVSNRGSLDRLLVSELVHDDLTLAVRVAMNEALYLRREAPPHRPPSRRALLLDAGVRMWGLPRLFGTAAAMALALQAGEDEVHAYRASGASVERFDLASREGLVSHLAALEPQPQPGAALPAFLEAAALAGGRLDAVVVTHPEAFADRGFQAALQASGAASVFVATVTREGEFTLWEWSGGNRRVLNQARLPIDGLFGEKKAAEVRRIVDQSLDPKLPIAVRTNPCPLLTARHLLGGHCVRLADARTAIASRDGRILIWSDPARGAVQIGAVNSPVRGLFALGPNRLLTVIGCLQPLRLEAVLLNLDDGTSATHPLEFEGEFRPREFFVYGGLLYVDAGRSIQIVDPNSGRHRQTLPLRGDLDRCGGRYCQATNPLDQPDPPGESELFAVVHDGQTARLEQVTSGWTRRWDVRVFDVVGADGPWVSNGPRMHNVEAAIKPGAFDDPTGPPLDSRITHLAQDGRRMIYSVGSSRFRRVLRGGRLISGLSSVDRAGDPSADHLGMPPELWVETSCNRCQSRVLRRRFYDIGSVGSDLVLFGRSPWRLTPAGGTVSARRPINPASVRMKRGFVSVHRLPGVRYFLRVAEWKDGSRAYLDSRGMLHLLSSDASVPELSVAISGEGPPAVWSADGRRWGDAYFHPSGATIEAGDGWCDLVRRFVERLR
ncbi:MAG TPA: hypothetical protein VGE52_05540 [Pirellulales bacterium]